MTRAARMLAVIPAIFAAALVPTLAIAGAGLLGSGVGDAGLLQFFLVLVPTYSFAVIGCSVLGAVPMLVLAAFDRVHWWWAALYGALVGEVLFLLPEGGHDLATALPGVATGAATGLAAWAGYRTSLPWLQRRVDH